MNLSEKYKPICLSELEIEYPELINLLNMGKTFIVNGPRYTGKSTIVKLYLDLLKYDYLLIDDFNLKKDNLIDKLEHKIKSVFSYFTKKKFIIIIDNFDLFDANIKDYIINNRSINTYLLITNMFLSTRVPYIRIHNYSMDYLLCLYCNIFFIETNNNCLNLPIINNINQMFSTLEFNLNSSNSSNSSNYEFLYDNSNYKLQDLIQEKDFTKKLYIIDKLNNYGTLHNNLIYNYKSIDDLADSYNNLCDSTLFYKHDSLEYYSILSLLGTTSNLDNLKIIKENFQIKKKKNL